MTRGRSRRADGSLPVARSGRTVPGLLSAAVALLAVGCGGAAGGPGWRTTVDTLPSGALHVVNRPPGEGIRPTWLLEEELRIFGPGGDLWVPDHGNDQMSVYDPDGGFEQSHPVHIRSHSFVWRGSMGKDGRIFRPSITLGAERRPLLRVFDPEMNPADSLPLPPEPDVDPEDPPVPVTEAERFWAVVTDELDVPHVVRSRVAPADREARP